VHIRRSEIVSGVRLAATDAFITDERKRGSQPDLAQQPKRDGIMIYGEEWRRRRIAGYRLWMPEVERVMASAPTEGRDERKRLISPTRASNTLLIVKTLRWHICLIDSLKRSDIDTDLHRRRHRQHVDLLGQTSNWIILTDENVFESTKSVREILGLTAEFLALEPKARDVLLVASNDSST
jgi:hypothetical protein